jgi:hypothetical protein
MAYRDFSSGTDGHLKPSGTPDSQHLSINGETVDLPDASFVKDAHLTRDGLNLVLESPQGTVVIEGYFAADPAPNLIAPDGSTLTADLVESFTTGDAHFAANNSASDVSPVGAAQEVTGHATVTHRDGTVETVVKGTPIFEGDIVETDTEGAVNIVFADQTSFAVSEDARLAIDKYVFDPSTQSGSTDFSILKGVFVFTSGLIGRDDPDDVKIDTPAGSIGIRGTIIAGNIHTGEITVVEGAIVLHDFQGHEITLATQFDTARFSPSGGGIEHVGQLSAHDVGTRFTSVSHVSPTLFSSISDAAHDSGNSGNHGSGDTQGDVKQGQPDAPVQGPADIHGDAGPAAAPMGPAPLAPMGLTNISGFGNTSGFAPATMGMAPPVHGPMGPMGTAGSIPGMTIVNGTAPGGTAAAIVAGTNPVIDPNHHFDPNTSGTNNPPPPVNHVPFHVANDPVQYFAAMESQDWNYRFSLDFVDQDPGDPLHYQLSAATIANLNAATSNGGAAGSPDLLVNGAGFGVIGFDDDGNGTVDDASERHGWSFNTNTGALDLYLYSTFDTTYVAAGSSYIVGIDVQAIDSHGSPSTFHHYAFSAYNPNATAASVYTGDGNVVSVASGTVIRGDNNNLFMDSSNATLSFQNAGGGNTGADNVAHLGHGTNIVTIGNTAYDNFIIGNDGQDKFIFATNKMRAFGMAGDDKFTFDFATGGATLGDSQLVTPNGLEIDGGSSDFRAGVLLRTEHGLNIAGLGTGGRGDTLDFQGVGGLNLTTMNASNHISGIERIDMAGSTGNQVVTLNYNAVFNMTDVDSSHTLIINVGNGDTLNLNGAEFAGMRNAGPARNNILVDDNVTYTAGVTGDDTQYDVYTDGHITVLIHQDAGGVVNMDGQSVNIAA